MTILTVCLTAIIFFLVIAPCVLVRICNLEQVKLQAKVPMLARIGLTVKGRPAQSSVGTRQ